MCQGVAVCEAEVNVVVLGAAVGMKARRSIGVTQQPNHMTRWNWDLKVILERYGKP